MRHLLLVIAVAPAIGAQGLVVPSSHFGALTIPGFDLTKELSISFDRFTDSTKRVDYLDPERVRQYAVNRTMGLNMAAYSFMWRNRRIAGVGRAAFGAGWLMENPTFYLQNDFLHDFEELERIPHGSPYSERFIWSVASEYNFWFDNELFSGTKLRLISPAFVGVGGAVSAMHDEIYLQAGIKSVGAEIGHAIPLPRLSAMVRAAPYVGSRAWALLPTGTHAKAYTAFVYAVELPVDEWWDVHGWIPAVEWAATSSTGLFLSPPSASPSFQKRRISERLCGVGLSWARDDFHVETYNDSCGNKDQGPTFGVRTWIRWR